MSDKIQKINNLTKLEGFIQLNFVKGFKYVDKAGEFFNHFFVGDKFPKHAMDPTGMIVKIDDKTDLKVSPYQLWMHFSDPASFDLQKREFVKKAELANSIFEPEKYTRLGWRNHLVYESGSNYPSIVPQDYLVGSEFNEIVFTKKINDFEARISVSKLIKTENETKAILFDIDLFKKEDFGRENFSSHLNNLIDAIEDTYKSEELLAIINNLLK